MALRLSKAARSTKATSLLASKNSGDIQIYTGSPPSTVDAALGAQVLLVTFSLAATAGVIVDGVFTANSVADAVSVAAGTAAWYRQRDSGGTVMHDGIVTASGGGGEAIIDNVTIASGQTISFLGMIHTEGNAD